MKQRFLKIFTRNGALFTGGLLGVVHETLLTNLDRPTLLLLFAAMMGLPAFLSPSISPIEKEEKKLEEQDLAELRLERRIQRDQEALAKIRPKAEGH